MSHCTFIGLGSNLDNPKQHIIDAFTDLSKITGCQLINQSSLYQSSPMGPQDQGDYINAVAQLSAALSPIELLDQLQAIENKHGRVRNKEQWGPRTLDLDLLLFDQLELNIDRLIVPHYGIKDRAFVLLPLHEINQDLQLPDGSLISELASNLDLLGIKKL